ncbi:LacI family transcriptional regulator [Streptosporangium sp. NBC_01639]|uniref:LacI family DNA-binding transcriptional regulator n=1 Tax=unclassified Streptosporangium TaxID=2632669 RepID=UPI002DD9AAD8|nr:LacI family DNA-binding transcriptional regulator [Streptosporangium sp. NBC_01756]WSC87767.1 LacI family transcriptional regulator [Streptosporangium sp. NBC_01756]WTD53555.1 LacI family transcriptional regulator [Streptosporangium sp. NBC_01639]
MVTLEDVARQAGVSLATASRVLNGSTRQVGASLRTKVELAAAQLGYRTNVAAQTLARGASNVIGLVVHDLTDPYFAAIADGAMRVAESQGLVVMVGTTHRDPEREIAYVSTLNAQRVGAVLLAGSRVADPHVTRGLREELDHYRRTGGRVACVGQDLLGVDSVVPGNREGAAALAQALAGLGHRRFAVLAGPAGLITAGDRTAGFAGALAGLGLPAPQVVHGSFDRDGGYAAAAAVSGATCVFAVNDVMAVGALASFRDRGIRVPEDVSVAGFDDIATLRDLVPALTTVRLPLADMGARALELALGSDEKPRVVHVSGEVVLRESARSLA